MHLAKADIRKNGFKRRDGLDLTTRTRFAARLAAIAPRLVYDFAPVNNGALVSLFSPIGSEPDTMPLAAVLGAAGLALSLPVDWSPGSPLVHRRWKPGDRLALGPLGIREPLENAPVAEPDVLIFPLGAFDRRGHRVGYGAGNVDRTLSHLRARKNIRAIGVAYAVQEVPLVPNDEHDQAFDIIITDQDVLTCRG